MITKTLIIFCRPPVHATLRQGAVWPSPRSSGSLPPRKRSDLDGAPAHLRPVQPLDPHHTDDPADHQIRSHGQPHAARLHAGPIQQEDRRSGPHALADLASVQMEKRARALLPGSLVLCVLVVSLHRLRYGPPDKTVDAFSPSLCVGPDRISVLL